MGSAAGCCTDDPSKRDTINTEKQPTRTAPKSKSPKQETKGYESPPSKQLIPDQSKSQLDIPEKEEPEESLQVPSQVSKYMDDGHEPVLPSDVESEPDKYDIKNDENIESPKEEQEQETAEKVDEENEETHEYQQEDDNKPDEVPLEIEPKPVESQEIEQEEPIKVEDEPKSEPEAKPKHKQIQVLEDEELRQLSVNLVSGENGEFIKFLKKILKSKLNDKIWNKCDPNNTGKIETEKFMYFWTLPVTLFKVAVHQRKHGGKKKPKIDQTALKKEFTHLATWIVRRYGQKQADGGATFVLSKENFTTNIVEYVQQYANVKGELYEDY